MCKMMQACKKAVEINLMRLLRIEEHSFNGKIYTEFLCDLRKEAGEMTK